MYITSSPLFYIPFIVVAFLRVVITGVLCSLLFILVKWAENKFRFRFKNLALIILVLASVLIGTYKSSQAYSGMWVAIAFDGYMDKDEDLFFEYWSKFYVHPFAQKSCYSQNSEKCQSWARFLSQYTTITSSDRFWAYLNALVFGFISGGISLLISKFINSLWKGCASNQVKT